MARQNINIGTTANDGTGDKLRVAFDKVNDNFIELYEQGDKGTKGEKGEPAAEGGAGAQGAQGVQGATGAKGEVGAQGIQGDAGAKGDKGEIGSKGDIGAQGSLGAQGETGSKGDKGNIGSQGEQGQKGESGGGAANTANVTFQDNIVVGTGDEFGSYGLNLAAGPSQVANLQYLRLRGGDDTAHIHFDTANSEAYDFFMGDDSKYVKLERGFNGNVSIGTFGGGFHTWTFDNNGTFIAPGRIQSGNNFDFLYNDGFGLVPYFGWSQTDAETLKLRTNLSAGDLNTDVFSVDRQSQNVSFTANISATNLGNVSALSLTGSSSDVLYGNGTFAAVVGGATGAQGVQGAVGAQGIQGAEGAQGVQGAVGAQGEQGVAGPQGDQGAAGSQGDQGAAGAQGDQGAQGTKGDKGDAGTASLPIANGSSNINIANASSNVTVTANSYTWNFNEVGHLYLPLGANNKSTITFATNPGGGSLDQADIQFYAASGENTVFEIRNRNDTADSIKLDASGPVRIVTDGDGNIGGPYTWEFGNNGSLTTPDAIQTSAIRGKTTTLGLYSLPSGVANTGIDLNNQGDAVIYSNANTIISSGLDNYQWKFDNTGILTLPPIGGDEGGELNFSIAASNTTLLNPVKIDVYQDRLRIFDGSTKGAYIDLSQAGAGVSTLLNNRVAAFVNAGTFVTMDNIKATVTTSGNRGLSLATVSGSFSYNIGGNYATGGGSSGSVLAGQTLTTTATSSIFGWGFTVSGDLSTYVLTDTTNNRCYRITLQIGGSFNNNSIVIERLI